MTKKIKITLIVSIAIVLIATTVTVVCYSTDDCYSTDSFDQNDMATWFATARNGGINDELAEQIEVGMTFTEIVELIGRPQEDIGSGVFAPAWELKSGKKLIVYTTSVTPDITESDTIPPSDEWIAREIVIK